MEAGENTSLQMIGLAKGKLWFSLILFFFLAALSLWVMTLPYNEAQTELRNTWRQMGSWLSFPLFLFLAIVSLLLLVDRKAGIRMDKTGLFYKVSVFSKGFFTWDEITNIELGGKGQGTHLVIQTKNGKPKKITVFNLADTPDGIRNQVMRFYQSQTGLGSTAPQKKRW